MKTMPASQIPVLISPKKKSRGQGLVEFALILPVLLVMIFVIVEIARLLHAWLAVENGARFGVRFAITGEYDPNWCTALYGGPCGTLSEVDGARIPSIKDIARAGSVAILKDETVAIPGQRGFFHVTICSSKRDVSGAPLFQYRPSDPDTPLPAECIENATLLPLEDPGGPGDRVSVTVDFDHPLITPGLSNIWPVLHLNAKREGIVEQFRTARVVGLPATISGPTWTPSPSHTATMTFTPSITPLPTDTPSPSPSPTVTPTPDCSAIYISDMWISGDNVRADVVNDNIAAAFLIETYFDWPKLSGSMRVNWIDFNGTDILTSDDSSPPTDVLGTNVRLNGESSGLWDTDFSGEPYEPIWGSYSLTLVFNFPDWGTCTLSDSVSRPQPPSPTPSRTATTGPSRTPTRTPTIGPSPTRTPTRTPSKTATPGPPPTDTTEPPPATNTPPPCTEC